ncbi:DUF3043 domain-containing protein [Corynebacterium sp. P7003]|uniref:DUF3043 domain-containing protein n=1 Tax=Corynebacterium pygosceleis TaxID=2800406 RepID=A0ABT3WPG1_9CORY|nr:DUF3043 domain-containing protein [Corynebacterium pygosceleis]MCX7444152.1 DUF3043 domain-containing protein [Corynebacterium pygosceleis]
MKLPWQKTSSTDADGSTRSNPTGAGSADGHGTSPSSSDSGSGHSALPKGYTPPKGRPTPKRREVEREKGIIRESPDTPQTLRQMRERKKALKASMSKEEYKAYKKRERDERAARRREVQKHIDAGDDRYLQDRDKGDERRFARDWVDSHRFLNSMFMPVALVLLVVMFTSQYYPALANVLSLLAMGVILMFFIEGFIIGRRVNRATRERFPGSTAPGASLGFYAYTRSTQPRKLRSPKPRVNVGDEI